MRWKKLVLYKIKKKPNWEPFLSSSLKHKPFCGRVYTYCIIQFQEFFSSVRDSQWLTKQASVLLNCEPCGGSEMDVSDSTSVQTGSAYISSIFGHWVCQVVENYQMKM
jgi:hypothetical protein